MMRNLIALPTLAAPPRLTALATLTALYLALTVAGAARAEVEEVKPLHLAAAGFTKHDNRYKLSAQPLADYLAAGLKRPVKLISYPGYNDVLVSLASEGIELAILPPIVNLHSTDAGLTRPLAYGIYPTGTYTYRAYILTRKDETKIKTLADLKGKKVGFVDIGSASGYIYPKLTLVDQKIGPKDVIDVFCGNHTDCLKALEAGQVDAAAVYELIFAPEAGGLKKLSDYTVLGTTDPIPAEAVVATSRLSKEDAALVQDLLFSFYARRNENEQWKAGRYIGFIPPDPFVLSGVRRSYERLIPPEPAATH